MCRIMRPWSILGVAVLATIALWAPVVEIYNREKILPPEATAAADPQATCLGGVATKGQTAQQIGLQDAVAAGSFHSETLQAAGLETQSKLVLTTTA